MKSEIGVTIYGALGNGATIRMPGRNNPAVALQSDTLKSLIDQIREAAKLMAAGELAEAGDELSSVGEFLENLYRGLIADITAEGESLV